MWFKRKESKRANDYHSEKAKCLNDERFQYYLSIAKIQLNNSKIGDWPRYYHELNCGNIYMDIYPDFMSSDIGEDYLLWRKEEDESKCLGWGHYFAIELMEYIQGYIGKRATGIYHCKDWTAYEWINVGKLTSHHDKP